VAKNEGYKTVISVRGVGNETNQNAIAAPSVAYHIDGIFIASPFSLQTDFIGVDRIEVLRGPQGTLFGQNSTGGAINVVTKAPSLNESYSSGSLTLGEYNMTKLSGSASGPIFENVAATFSFTKTKRDGFSTNIFNGQDLDDDDSYSVRNDYFIDLDDSSSLRIFGQYANIDSNGSAMKGLDDTTVGARNLKQDSLSELKLTSSVLAGIYEKDLGYANLKVLASSQSDSISVRRDNDRHFYQDAAPSLTGVSTYQRSEYRFETSDVKTKTFEINLISNEPLIDGKLDWTVGAFYMDQEIENHIREYLDEYNSSTNAAGQDGIFKYVCGEPFADPNYCVSLPTGFGPGQTNPYAASTEFGFITDAFPERRSLSIFGQTTYSFDDDLRLISGFRYTRDNFLTDVSNFFGVELYQEDDTDEETSGRLTLEYDLDADSMVYLSQTRGFKPGGTNLTFGASGDGTPAMVLPTFKSETLDSTELGFKTEFFDGRALANIAIFDYTYKNLQVQGTDPDVFKGGVVNIPESEVQGLELEFTASLSDSWTIDANFAYLDSEITSSFEYLDNAKAQQYSFGGESNRYALREDVKGKELAKTPEITADISLIYSTQLASGDVLNSSLQFVKRGKFFQRIVNNPVQDPVDGYEIINFSSGVDYASGWGFDIMVTNVGDEDGMNSAMTDVFGVGATGIEYIPPRQVMTRLSYDF
jgi:iron complex outermembrane receptor protein